MRMARRLNVRQGWPRVFLLLTALSISMALSAGKHTLKAQTCGSDYVVKEGESLADISARVYGNSSQWSLIFYANQDRMGANASMLVPGLSVRIPCLGGQQPAVTVAPSSPSASTSAQPSSAATPAAGA